MAKKIYVWDKFVRLFHWSLVVLFCTSYLTGEAETELHIYSGYGIFALVLTRIGWGLIGSRHARFSDFVTGPSAVFKHAKAMLSGEGPSYRGHNPLGGWMIIALLTMLLLTTLSGMKLYAVEEGKGPLASRVSLISQAQASPDEDEDHHFYLGDGYQHAYRNAEEEGADHEADEEAEEIWEEIHEASVNGLILLIILHIAGVIISSRLEAQSLVRAMITGNKQE